MTTEMERENGECPSQASMHGIGKGNGERRLVADIGAVESCDAMG